ncbi:hypothetical protein SAMN03159512_05824 [Pseudomonas sp. NFR09]|nr:hypothetical protein SAMN03159512_05824 [Pseudomonas sp. NFR09]
MQELRESGRAPSLHLNSISLRNHLRDSDYLRRIRRGYYLQQQSGKPLVDVANNVQELLTQPFGAECL